MKNNRLLIVALSILVIFGLAVTFKQVNQLAKDPLQKHIENATDFDIVSFKNNSGNIDIVLETLDTPHWTREDFIQLETRIIYDAVKHFPREDIYTFENITVRFVTENTNREISKIIVSSNTLVNKDWIGIENYQLEDNVDTYFYKP